VLLPAAAWHPCEQIEGAPSAGGKGPSIWDTFSHTPGKVAGNDTGDVAVDHYHRFKQDVALMQRLDIRYYKWVLGRARVRQYGSSSTGPLGQGLFHSSCSARQHREGDDRGGNTSAP
jgi:beta-glucosidase